MRERQQSGVKRPGQDSLIGSNSSWKAGSDGMVKMSELSFEASKKLNSESC